MMKRTFASLALFAAAALSAAAQEPAKTAAAPAPPARTKLQELPRDEKGFLKPEVWALIEADAKANPTSNEARALQSRPMIKAYYATYATWTAPEPPAPPPGRLRNLSDTPKTPRFPLTGKVWPAKPGEASVCLWEDDKLAAMSLGVDDNSAGDLPYWRELSKKYGGLAITWNLITCNINGAIDKGRGPSAGSWAAWKQLRDEGYHLVSHSVTHLHDPVPADGWPGPDWEAAESIRTLDSHLPGQKTKLFVYPGAGVSYFGILGGYYPNSSWRPAIVKYYAAARGGGGEAINPANQIDYFNIHATTGSVPDLLGSTNPRMASQNLNKLFDPDPKNPNYRGWANIFIHFINNGKDFDTNPFTIAYGKTLAFYNDHRADLWTGFIDDVALYGQERDTATLTPEPAGAAELAFTLTTQMDPAVFDYPLTVKVRLPDAWQAAAAAQNHAVLPVQVIRHEGAPYALVKVVPDRGRVTLAPR